MINDFKLPQLLDCLTKKLRIQDWDISLKLVSENELSIETKEFNESNTLGYCKKHRNLKFANIFINVDNIDNDEIYITTIIHELLHIYLDDILFNVESILEYIDNKQVRRIESDNFDTIQERATEQLSCIIYNSLGGLKFFNKFKYNNDRRNNNHGKNKK